MGSLLWTVCGRVDAQTWSTRSGRAEFTSQVPLHEFTGTSDHLVGMISLADSTVDFYLDLETLETGIGKRDRDMRRTLDTEEVPFAEFFGKLVTPFDPEQNGVQEARVRGVFHIHGVQREIEVAGTLQVDGENLLLDAGWTLNLTDYDIKPPRLLVIRVDEEQDIRIRATLTPGPLN